METAERGKEQRFGKQLPHDARAASAQCHADADLAFAGGAAGQHQCPKIGAGRNQHHRHQRRGRQQYLELVAVVVELMDWTGPEILALVDVIGP
jgi:hypothetical protein